MKILVFTDLHYFGDDMKNARFNTAKKLVKYAVPMLEEFAKLSEREGYSLVVNLGDVIQDTNNKERDIECLEYMFDKLKAFKCPCYTIFGNHDMKMMDSEKEVEKLIGYENSTYSIDFDGFHLVFLTTEVRPEFGLDRGGSYKTHSLSDKNLEWLKNDLEKNTLPCLIFSHFPIADDERVQDECMFMKNREKVREIINKHNNILAVISGHQHTPREVEQDGLMYYIPGSPTTSLLADGIPIGAYIEIETEGKNITVTRKHIELQ